MMILVMWLQLQQPIKLLAIELSTSTHVYYGTNLSLVKFSKVFQLKCTSLHKMVKVFRNERYLPASKMGI